MAEQSEESDSSEVRNDKRQRNVPREDSRKNFSGNRMPQAGRIDSRDCRHHEEPE